jgi:lipopolysaccharide biosynthesis glycosyltransferase
MSSCDEGYAKLVPVQLLSISDNLVNVPNGMGSYEVHYYLFHSRAKEETIEAISTYSETLGIAFHEIKILDTEPYAELASKGGGWAYEAYFTIDCHRYLPQEVDRVLYIDAADVLILRDIGEYYFSDFEKRSMLVTCGRYKSGNNGEFVVFENEDLGDKNNIEGIFRGLFNSGSFVLNTDKLRKANIPIDDYIRLKAALEKMYPDRKTIYFGDQGLLSVAFAGDIKYFRYPEAKNLWFQPYNFCVWFFDRATEICGGNPWYIPCIIHFAGGIKPWKLTEENINELKPGQWPFYKIYEMYSRRVPDIFS